MLDKNGGGGTCLIQGLMCDAWTEHELEELSKLVSEMTPETDNCHQTPPAIMGPITTTAVAVASVDKVTASSTDGVTASSTDCVTASSTDGVTASSTDGVTVSTTDGVTASSTDGVTASSTDGVTARSTDGVTASTTNDVTASPTNDVAASTTNDTPVYTQNDLDAIRHSMKIQIKEELVNDLKVQIKNELKIDYNRKISKLEEKNEKLEKQSQLEYTKLNKEIESLKSKAKTLQSEIDALKSKPVELAASLPPANSHVERGAPQRQSEPDGEGVPALSLASGAVDLATSGAPDPAPEATQDQRGGSSDSDSADDSEERAFGEVSSLPQITTSRNPQSFKVPNTSTKVLIGDSNLKNINRKRLDTSGKTYIRSIGGLTVPKVTSMLSNTKPNPGIAKVIVHVGSNDIDNGSTPTQLSKDVTDMCAALRMVFPAATIFISGILPQKGVRTNTIITFNHKLKSLSETCNFCFLWNIDDFLARESFPSHLFARDKYHLNAKGLGVLLRGFMGVIRNDNNTDSSTRLRNTNVQENTGNSLRANRDPVRPIPTTPAPTPANEPLSPAPQSQDNLPPAPTLVGAGHFPPLPERNRGAGHHTQRPSGDQSVTVPIETSSSPVSAGESVPEAHRMAAQRLPAGPLSHPPLDRRVPPYFHRPINHPYPVMNHPYPVMMRGHYPGLGYPFPHMPYPFPPTPYTQSPPFPQFPIEF